MRVFRGVDGLPVPPPPTAVVIGTFDGVHRGHQALLALGRERAATFAAEAWVVTFDPHPSLTLGPSMAPPLLCTLEQRLELMAREGMDAVVVLHFDPELAATSCEDFVRRFILACGAREVVVGYDFTFGSGRAGDASTLQEIGEKLGVQVKIVPPVSVDGGVVPSSTKIRQLLLEGRVEAAAALLGRPHEVVGTVVTGEGRGRTIGFPTANVQVDGSILIPANGVYAVEVAIEGEHRRWAGAANVGTNPTFSAGSRVLFEIHIIEYSGPSLVGRRLSAGIVERLRDERRFPSADELVRQIESDVEAARRSISRLGR